MRERAIATLKTRRLPWKLRCSTERITAVVQAVMTLQHASMDVAMWSDRQTVASAHPGSAAPQQAGAAVPRATVPMTKPRPSRGTVSPA